MAPKETKKDRERHLKKAEELTTTADADAPTDANNPSDNNELEEELLYDAEGGLLKPQAGTSLKARAALAGSTAVVALATTDSSDADGVTKQEEKGLARTRSMPKRAKRASSRSSRSRSKPKKKNLKKDRRRLRKRESSSSSSDDDGSKRRGRGRSPSTSSCSSWSSGDSDWEEFYNHDTVVKVRALKAALQEPHATFPRVASPLKRRGRFLTFVRLIRG
jgi:hypothetical protein